MKKKFSIKKPKDKKNYKKQKNKKKEESAKPKKNTAPFEKSAHWYDAIVGKEGHYYHKNLILPYLQKVIKEKKITSILDLGCGQGILERYLFPNTDYLGIDISKTLIQNAIKNTKAKNHLFMISDLNENLDLKNRQFDAAIFLLSLQNIKEGEKAVFNGAKYLKQNGFMILVLNHPCFRIPRQSSWEIDSQKRMYRRIDAYMSFLEIPIKTHPSKKDKSQTTYSYHHPLSTYFQWLKKANLHTLSLEELISDKTSTGSASKCENRVRKQFPLFMVLIAKKL